MSEREFLHTTPRFFYYRAKGFDELQLEYWQRARMEAFYTILPHSKKNAIRKPQDLFALPGDAKEIRLTDEQRKQIAERLKIAKTVDWFNGGVMPKA